MAFLPSARQKKRGARPRPARRSADKQSLVQAFAAFTQAAESLEQSYGLLQTEVARMSGELEHANAELKRSLDENMMVRTFLSRILAGLPCGVLVFDQTRHLHAINPEARRLLDLNLELSAAETAGGTEVFDKLFAECSRHAGMPEFELCTDGPAARVLCVTQSEGPAKDGSGNGLICILRDVTEEKRLATERERLRRSEALAEIAMVLAHEIRNPLGSLELFAGLLADATDNTSETGRWVRHIQAGLRTLAATVNNVLHFHSEPSDATVAIQIARMLKETVEFLGPLAQQRGMKLRLENVSHDIWVRADGHRLQQVFLNLALNAFRAMSPGGQLLVTASAVSPAGGPQVRIDFEDQGVGVPPEQMQRLFEPGFTTHAGSSGLGLAVCKKVVEQHRGTISVHSLPRLGSTFTVTLPTTGALA
jgi:nitrogen fixation/metabolism regulation signal transduction histidine kinase